MWVVTKGSLSKADRTAPGLVTGRVGQTDSFLFCSSVFEQLGRHNHRAQSVGRNFRVDMKVISIVTAEFTVRSGSFSFCATRALESIIVRSVHQRGPIDQKEFLILCAKLHLRLQRVL